MRTLPLALLASSATLLLLPVVAAGAGGVDVPGTLDRLGLIPDRLAGSDPVGSAPTPSLPEPEARRNLLETLLDPVVDALETATSGFVKLGVLFGDRFVGGMEGAGDVVVAAADQVAAQPQASAVIATVAATAMGLASLLAYLAQRYGSLGAIPLYSRIARSALLENPVRGQIFDMIRNNPGINVSEVARRLDIAWGTATHHLHKLRQEKLVTIRLASNQKCYFQNGGSYTPQEIDVLSATKHETAKRIARFLADNGPTVHNEVASALSLKPALLSFHVEKLVASRVVSRTREGRRTILAPLESNLEPQPRAPLAH